MTIELNDAVISQTGLSPQQVLLELAIHLYETGMITVGQGGELTSLGHVGFQRELGSRRIPVSFDAADWEHDQQTLQTLGLL
ncbi:hypothetical protein GCM10027341_03980 [Spirosoma knui]